MALQPKTASRDLAKPKNAKLRYYYELYVMGRNTQLVIYVKKEANGKEKTIPVPWPSGILNWPNAGGILDQDYLVTRLFAAALRGDQSGTARAMAKG